MLFPVSSDLPYSLQGRVREKTSVFSSPMCSEEYAEKYNDLIQYIHRIQKDAVVIVMGVMYVTKEYSDTSEVFNNDNINARNSLVAGYIDGKDTMYLDINPAFLDESGCLDAKYTNDGIHLSAEYYELWVDFLKKHALENDYFK